jgi:hypothetical protein
METGMYDLVEKILVGVSFIAVGGALALAFFAIFAQSIFGSKTIHVQLDRLLQLIEQTNEQLKQIIGHLDKSENRNKDSEHKNES